jgi:Uma2 family endonuclease
MALNTIPVRHRLITVDEYDQMVRSGVFPEDDRLELIEGALVAMSPIGSRHAAQITQLTHLLTRHLDGRALVSVQNAVRLARSEPQPDLLLLRPRPDFYAGALPRPGDVLLLIEVADTTAVFDRDVKVPLYARSGIAETWLIDLGENVVEVYRVPAAGGYRQKQTLGMGDNLKCLAFPDEAFAVADILVPEA